MQSTCKPSQGEEGGTHTREAFLQVPSAGMQLFRMGTSGAGEVAEHAKEGAGSQSGAHQDDGRNGSGEEGTANQRGQHQRERIQC